MSITDFVLENVQSTDPHLLALAELCQFDLILIHRAVVRRRCRLCGLLQIRHLPHCSRDCLKAEVCHCSEAKVLEIGTWKEYEESIGKIKDNYR